MKPIKTRTDLRPGMVDPANAAADAIMAALPAKLHDGPLGVLRSGLLTAAYRVMEMEAGHRGRI